MTADTRIAPRRLPWTRAAFALCVNAGLATGQVVDRTTADLLGFLLVLTALVLMVRACHPRWSR